jgi:hypothetical protein
VVEVEVREPVGRVGRGEVDRGVVGARRAAHPPDAPQKRAIVGGQEGGAVMRVLAWATKAVQHASSSTGRMMRAMRELGAVTSAPSAGRHGGAQAGYG